MNFDRLRALLFQQAMRGQLVPQFDEEKSVNIMPIVTSDVPHELPRKWVWVRSDEILEFIRGVTFPASAKRSALSEGIVRCLTTGSVQKRHNLGKLFKSTLNNRLHRNLTCVIDKSSRGAK